MTEEMDKLIEQCASAVVLAQPGDVSALVGLHRDLEAVRDHASETPDAAAMATSAAALVEKIVLGDTSDAFSALRDVAVQINQLQSMLNGVFPRLAQEVPQTIESASAAPSSSELPDEHAIAEDDLSLVNEFVGEAAGHLDSAEHSLLKLEEDPSDLGEVNAVFRAFHTIKGVAGFLDFKQIGALAHATESLLDLARKSKLQLHGARLDVVLESRDLMKQMVQGVETAGRNRSVPARQPGLGALLQRLTSAARDDGFSLAPKAADISEEPVISSETASAAAAGEAPLLVADATVKVATGRLDTLINTVGELVIAQAMVAADLGAAASDQRLARNLSQLGKLTRSLQELSMSMRMVPIAGVFQKMARLARDVSRKAGKDVEFIQIGSETELDRNVVEAISDPLVHMVRNSIDHGLETPEERAKAGKPAAGRVVLKACHQGGNVVIELSDDGRGLPREKIIKKAIAVGIVKQGQELGDQEVFQLIFHPGLSTAEKITDISGRGVGMDVVKKNVEALRGRIEIASTQGKGSLFTVRLPLTLAVIDGLVVKVGRHRYIIPIINIEQSMRPMHNQLSTVQGKGEMCMVRDRLLPIVRLHRLFNVEAVHEDPTQALVVIIQDGPQRRCLLVDEVIGQHQVVIKSVGKEIGHLPGIAGCAILGDGNVSLILDVAGIIHSANQ